ncbi:putative oxidoreductase 2-nitropropane dioxygenase family [Trichoderma sp. SZMC 28013]
MASPLTASKTILSRYPWISSPLVVSAPMAVLSSPALATAVSSAGRLGFIGPGIKTQDAATNLGEASQIFLKTQGSPFLSREVSTSSLLPVGVAFLLWRDDVNEAVSAIEKFKPSAVWLYAPHELKEYEIWSKKIRGVSPDTQIWIQIGTVLEAKTLSQSSEKPDVIVVQGAESGGHGRVEDGLGLITLFPEVADALAESGITLVAAGGIADGRGFAAALSLGASGVAMGTRFLASREARIDQGYQNAVIQATNGAVSTTRTLLYNHLRGEYGWPKPYSPRMIINQTFIDHQAGKPFGELKEMYDEAVEAGDLGWGQQGRRATYAGAAIGLIHGVKSASDIVHDVRKEALVRIQLLHAGGK